MKFGRKLAALRRERGLSQERLAERIGVSRQAVAKWEAGESFPELPKLLLLGDCFRQSLDRLVRDHEDERCRGGYSRRVRVR
ncbi:MAG: helix-turn-helix domain-containing protein [Uliginosibacterium sp.]|nr:helix-turn-helix domain-containing protein [Uliginosibacterium sp.]